MTITAGICSYGNIKGLNDTLLSIAPIVDQIIIVNVPFLGFPVPEADPPLHIYEKESILRHPNITLYQNSEPLTQIECRNKYLELSKTDFLLALDDDEVVHHYNPIRFQNGLGTAMEMLGDNPFLFTIWYIQQNGTCNYLSRLLYLPQRFRYVDNHFHFSIDGKYHGAQGTKPIDGLTLKHQKIDESGRTHGFEKSMERYEIWQKFNERQY